MTEPELWTTAEAAEYLGASSAGSGRKTLSRLGVAPVSRNRGVEARTSTTPQRSGRPKRECLDEENNLRTRKAGNHSDLFRLSDGPYEDQQNAR